VPQRCDISGPANSTCMCEPNTHAERCASSGTGTMQSSLPVRQGIDTPLRIKKTILSPIIHHARETPMSRHAPLISPSESNPQIGLRRAPSSGPIMLRIGSRASPYLCVQTAKRESQGHEKGGALGGFTRSRKRRRLH